MKKPKFLQSLLKSKKDTDEVVEETNQEEEIEKSFDDALDELDKISKGKSDDDTEEGDEEEPIQKAKKKKKPFPSDDDDDDDDDDMKYKKSVDDVSADEDIFVDAEPIIKSLMNEVKELITGVSDRLAVVEEIQKAQAGVAVSQGKLLKSLHIEGEKPNPRKSSIKAEEKPFAKSESEDGAEGRTLEKAEATARLQSLIKSNKIESRQVALIESRIQKGAPLPNIMFEGFDGKDDGNE
jgi:hypothetical protein